MNPPEEICISGFHIFMEDIHTYQLSGFPISTWGEESTRVIDQSRNFSEELIGHVKHKE